MPPFALRQAKGIVGAPVRAVTPSQEQLDLHPEWTAGQAEDQLEQLRQLRERQEQLQRRQEEVEKDAKRHGSFLQTSEHVPELASSLSLMPAEERVVIFDSLSLSDLWALIWEDGAECAKLFGILSEDHRITMLNAVPQEHHAYLYIALCCNELPPEDRESMVSLLYEPAKTTLMELINPSIAPGDAVPQMGPEEMVDFLEARNIDQQMDALLMMSLHQKASAILFMSPDLHSTTIRQLSVTDKAELFAMLLPKEKRRMLAVCSVEEHALLSQHLSPKLRKSMLKVSKDLSLGLNAGEAARPISRICAHVGWNARLQFRIPPAEDPHALPKRTPTPNGTHTFFPTTQYNLNELLANPILNPDNRPNADEEGKSQMSSLMWLQAGDLRVKCLPEGWGLKRNRILHEKEGREHSIQKPHPAQLRRIMEPVVRPHTNWISAPEQLPVVRRGAKQPTYDHPYITQKVLKGPPLELTRAVRNDVFSRKGVREVLDANRQQIAFKLQSELEAIKATPMPMRSMPAHFAAHLTRHTSRRDFHHSRSLGRQDPLRGSSPHLRRATSTLPQTYKQKINENMRSLRDGAGDRSLSVCSQAIRRQSKQDDARQQIEWDRKLQQQHNEWDLVKTSMSPRYDDRLDTGTPMTPMTYRDRMDAGTPMTESSGYALATTATYYPPLDGLG